MLPNFRIVVKTFLPVFSLLFLIVLCNSATVKAQNSITIPSSGIANPYPSVITVSGQTGVVTKVTVTFTGFSHTFPDDIDIMLVSPNGRNAIILSDVGGGNPVSNANITLDDAAASSLPDEGQITSGTFKPTNSGAADAFPNVVPSTSANTALSTFNGIDPNGDWKLYVFDDSDGDAGSISNFTLNITTGAAPTAALGMLSGRVLSERNEAISGARVTALDTTTLEYHNAVTDASGNYTLMDLPVGNFYIITISHKRYTFSDNSQSIQLLDDGIMNFVAQSSRVRVF